MVKVYCANCQKLEELSKMICVNLSFAWAEVCSKKCEKEIKIKYQKKLDK